MSIQQDILDTIGPGGIEVKALRARLGNITANELDLAISALQRGKRVRVVNERYEVSSSTRPLGGMPHTGRPPSAEEEAAASLMPRALEAGQAKKRGNKATSPVNGSEALKVGHQTVNLAGTPPIAGSSPAGSTGLVNGASGEATLPGPSTEPEVNRLPDGAKPSPTASAIQGTPASAQPVVADRVFESVKAQRQVALNRIALLEVDIANERSRLSECEQFLRLYERFAEGAA